jgi:hypothetical protein
VFLDVDGRIRASVPAPFLSYEDVIAEGASLVLVSSFEQQRIDLGGDTLTRYRRVEIGNVETVGRRGPGALRAVSTPYIDGRFRLRVTDLVLDGAQATGFVVREGMFPQTPELGNVELYDYAASGNLIRLVGPGDFRDHPVRSILLEVADVPGTGEPLSWRLVEDTTLDAWPRRRAILGMTGDLRHALVRHYDDDSSGSIASLEPLSPGGRSLRMVGYARALHESEGTVSILFEQGLQVFARDDLQRLAHVAFNGYQPLAAQTDDRAAVLSHTSGNGEARVLMRCTAIPRTRR